MPWGKNNGESLVPVLLARSLHRAFSSDPKPVHSASYAASCSLSPEDSLVTTSVSPAGPWVPLLATCPWKVHFQPHALLLAERSHKRLQGCLRPLMCWCLGGSLAALIWWGLAPRPTLLAV